MYCGNCDSAVQIFRVHAEEESFYKGYKTAKPSCRSLGMDNYYFFPSHTLSWPQKNVSKNNPTNQIFLSPKRGTRRTLAKAELHETEASLRNHDNLTRFKSSSFERPVSSVNHFLTLATTRVK